MILDTIKRLTSVLRKGLAMKRFYILIVSLLIASETNVFAQTIKVTTLDGGSVVTELTYGIKVNRGSSLRRTWVVLNDPRSPVQLKGVGVLTRYKSNGGYSYIPTGSLSAREAISAIEVRFLLFDVFGEHIKPLSGDEVTEILANKPFKVGEIGSWRAWESDVSALLTVVAFVGHVRTKTGTIWRYNSGAIEKELNKIRLKVTSGVLEPTKEK